ncbi:MAG: 2-C-methyl-D-erythritol 2,4-cyclodiphosphate synthase [Candidatus Eisenbacteria bacterium]|nr:2-C-methyl-D-erythritol 2,4-cyclodiphosphate synthase [Candidatus Eisenbacteria bacterium]
MKPNHGTQGYRTGIGYDAHPFVEGRPLVLGGVNVPHARGLGGHSDADVLCHAIADALLGAAAAGDIGTHFPDTESRYRGVSSIVLLGGVRDLVAKTGARIVNVDSVLVIEEPRVSPYFEEMRSRIAEALHVEPGAISVKATRNEGMGFIGRAEGAAAFAVATLVMAESDERRLKSE